MKRLISVSLDEEDVEKVDKERGDVPRAAFIRRLIRMQLGKKFQVTVFKEKKGK